MAFGKLNWIFVLDIVIVHVNVFACYCIQNFIGNIVQSFGQNFVHYSVVTNSTDIFVF